MLNNEQVGISAEIAIADTFGVSVNPAYRSRGVNNIVQSIRPIVKGIFATNPIPRPIEHIAERQNKIDFNLTGGKTLSVKTNKQALGKAAPQRIGQATSQTWYNYLTKALLITNVPAVYAEKARLFKRIALSRIDELLTLYWENMFDCDYLIHIYNVVDENDHPTSNPRFVVFKKSSSPIWDKNKFSFTKSTVEEWNESTTVKYDNIAIGEFQVHNNRDNFKFRFNMAGIVKLLEKNKLTFS
ncbi:hypothetical protein IKF74_02140 [Candidatus Saccharibacteria bacterium]|nr:hypothetical protein [Candidatus Saccharibacteria bacterium]